jgi:hypothetical protein
MIARKDAFVAIANPVALYIVGFAPLGWQTPDGSDSRDFWKIVRGDQAHALRAVYEVPVATGFTVGDITIDGLPIAFDAQIVDFIIIKLVGQAAGIGKNVVPPVTPRRRRRHRCGGRCQVEPPRRIRSAKSLRAKRAVVDGMMGYRPGRTKASSSRCCLRQISRPPICE